MSGRTTITYRIMTVLFCYRNGLGVRPSDSKGKIHCHSIPNCDYPLFIVSIWAGACGVHALDTGNGALRHAFTGEHKGKHTPLFEATPHPRMSPCGDSSGPVPPLHLVVAHQVPLKLLFSDRKYAKKLLAAFLQEPESKAYRCGDHAMDPRDSATNT